MWRQTSASVILPLQWRFDSTASTTLDTTATVRGEQCDFVRLAKKGAIANHLLRIS
ncbi:MAG TPA: hypothetical protein VE956_21850 [Nodularia sp. (in: cyanobacteria)]|nr:hypothetical protein [Nodularia sp. (in: cyanobacteria)]